MPRKNRLNDLDCKKAKYCSWFLLRMMRYARILAKGELLGVGNGSWRNVTEHCLVESIAGDILAEALSADRRSVMVAGLLHDWYKKAEVLRIKERGPSAHFETSREDMVLLAGYGISAHIITLAHSNVLESLDIGYLSSRSIEAKILHWLDVSTEGSRIVDFRDRIMALQMNLNGRAFSESFRGQYDGRTLFDVQWEHASKEQAEFEQKLGIPFGDLVSFVVARFDERIAAA